MRKRDRRNRRPVIIVVSSAICLLVLITVGYAAFSTKLNLTAKGNIVEMTHAEFGGVEVATVTEGDGLYEDEYENRYIYKGTSPNNYITFNNEVWRILSIESDGSIKIIRNEVLKSTSWNTSSDSNNWVAPASLNTYLNEEYLESITTNNDKIISYTWSIGAVTQNNSDLASQINDENSSKFQSAKVGLITVSEYIRTNTNVEVCGNLNLYNTNYETCKTTNWQEKSYDFWTITADSSSLDQAFLISNSVYGQISLANVADSDSAITTPASQTSPIYIIPAVYLTSSITLSGNGTQADPYIISN